MLSPHPHLDVFEKSDGWRQWRDPLGLDEGEKQDEGCEDLTGRQTKACFATGDEYAALSVTESENAIAIVDYGLGRRAGGRQRGRRTGGVWPKHADWQMRTQ